LLNLHRKYALLSYHELNMLNNGVNMLMSICHAPDLFQESFSSIFVDMPKNAIVYQEDDLMITTNGTIKEHLQMLNLVLTHVHDYNVQINHKKCKFCECKAEFLGFCLTLDGILPQQMTVQAIYYRIAPPNNVHQVHSFLGAINHYKQLFPQCKRISPSNGHTNARPSLTK